MRRRANTGRARPSPTRWERLARSTCVARAIPACSSPLGARRGGFAPQRASRNTKLSPRALFVPHAFLTGLSQRRHASAVEGLEACRALQARSYRFRPRKRARSRLAGPLRRQAPASAPSSGETGGRGGRSHERQPTRDGMTFRHDCVGAMRCGPFQRPSVRRFCRVRPSSGKRSTTYDFLALNLRSRNR